MNCKLLITVYLFTAFMVAFGFDFLIQGSFDFQPFRNTQFIYSLASMLMLRVLLKWIWPKKNGYKIIGVIILYYFFFISFRYILEEIIVAHLIGFGNYNPDVTALAYMKDNTYYGSIHFMFGLIIFLIDKQIENQQKQAILIANYHKAELDFLRLQISPHFLFNALNAIYVLTYKKSPKAPEAVMQLSDLMRYMLYEKSDKIELEKEWHMVLSYIELQKLRIKDDMMIEINTQGDLGSIKVPPYTLLPFIENAFKHGDFNSRNASFVINLNVSNDNLTFNCKNKISSQPRHLQTGIGIENLRKRLDILYPKNYKLKLDRTSNNEFEVSLIINLIT